MRISSSIINEAQSFLLRCLRKGADPPLGSSSCARIISSHALGSGANASFFQVTTHCSNQWSSSYPAGDKSWEGYQGSVTHTEATGINAQRGLNPAFIRE